MKTNGSSVRVLLENLRAALDRAFAEASDAQSRLRAAALDAQFCGLLSQLPQAGGTFDPTAWDALPDAQKQQFTVLLESLAGTVAEMIGPDEPSDAGNFMHRAYASTASIFLLFAAAIMLTLVMLVAIVSSWPKATGTAPSPVFSRTNTAVVAPQSFAPAPLAGTNPSPPVVDRTNASSANVPPLGAGRQLTGPLEADMLRMIIYMGALGGLLHLTSSLAKYVGNRQLLRSWILYYWLMPVEGAALAPIVYLLLRVSVLGIPTNPSMNPTAPLNYIGLYAFAGLTGLFSKQALEMLGQVFAVIFQRVAGKDPLDKSTGGKPPTGK